MSRVIQSQHLWIGLGLFVLFCICTLFVPNRVTLLITNCLVLVGAVAVGLVYLPTAIKAIREKTSDRIQHIALGIVYAWAFTGLWRIWGILWLTGGQENWMFNNDVVALFQAGVFLGAAYHLTSPGAAAGSFRGRIAVVALVVALSLLLAAFLDIYKPNTKFIVDHLEPYVPR